MQERHGRSAYRRADEAAHVDAGEQQPDGGGRQQRKGELPAGTAWWGPPAIGWCGRLCQGASAATATVDAHIAGGQRPVAILHARLWRQQPLGACVPRTAGC